MSEEKFQMTAQECIQLCMYIPEKINRCINLLAQKYLKDTNLKPYYVPYIINIKRVDGISQKQLKVLIPYDKSRISVVIHELIDRGLVYNDGAGRNSSLHLTEDGHAVFSICKMFFDIVNKEIFGWDENIEKEIVRQNMILNDRLDDLIDKLS